MKRSLLLIALPAVLLVVWASQNVGGKDSATVDITAQNPAQLRSGVIARMAVLGGVRIGEKSHFSGAGSSDLRFSVPTARLEDALSALGTLGGRVTDQDVNLSDSTAAAQSVQSGLASTRQCIDDVSAGSSSNVSARVSQCLSTVDRVSQQFGHVSLDSPTSQLAVNIHPASDSNPLLVIAIIVLLLAAAGLTFMVWRSSRATVTVDLRDGDGFQNFDSDGFMRRN